MDHFFPGAIVCLHSYDHNRYMQMSGDLQGVCRIDVSEKRSNANPPPKSEWPWIYFLVVDMNEGAFALWNSYHGRFLRMTEDCMDVSTRREFTVSRIAPLDEWPCERFHLVDCGHGLV